MFLYFREEVKRVLKDALKVSGFEDEAAEVELSDHADLASSVAFKLASKYRKSPKDLSEEIVRSIKIPNDSLISHVEASGPYINFFASNSFLIRTIEQILKERENFGHLGYKERIILEHTSANPNGPLHVGHIRNSIIGDTLTRILRKAGYDVEVQYYVNDMGRQIAMVVWGLSKFNLPDKKSDHATAEVYIAANGALEDNPEFKQEVDRLIQMKESGDEETSKKFEGAVKLCLAGITSTLERMNVHHDRFVWESEFVSSGDVQDIIESVEKSKYSEMKDGALVLNLEDFGFEKEYVVRRSDGTSLYSTRDLAYHQWKSKGRDRIIDVFGADHKLISSQLVPVLDILGIPTPEIVIFEFVSLPEGSMSTRRGKFISADELLDEVEAQAYLEVDKRRSELSEDEKSKIARMVGIGAVRYDIIRISPEKSTIFDWRNALDFEKQGAPFIQYAHARCCSIIRRSDGIVEADPSLLTEGQEVELIKKMSLFPLIIETAAKDLKPYILATYARELTELFNQFYRDVPVLNAEKDIRNARLTLVECVRIVLREALDVNGIEAPESM
ncbi:MAG: arginine--tRNA ligase [Halobacteriota archaeon]|nr:arginine--tRNA ligase [Halobacteriota archaeon]